MTISSSSRRTRRDHLTFKGNSRQTRYGWLRLTPAYSVHQVEAILDATDQQAVILDPFCGTGTTALVCAEHGISCDTIDINPFLAWLASAKTRLYRTSDIDSVASAAAEISRAICIADNRPLWVPSLHQIEKWWDGPTLTALSRAWAGIRRMAESTAGPVVDLLKIAFCRTIIAHAHVTFGHQSMSFKKRPPPDRKEMLLPGFGGHPVAATFEAAALEIASAARSPIARKPCVRIADARNLESTLTRDRYTCVITSPPYPNRMSYIRELRPYMYWLGYLDDGRAAGELDWLAIGGTWGCATSNLSRWHTAETAFPCREFPAILNRIAQKSEVLSKYVHKYFVDMLQHCRGLFRVVRVGGTVHYIVGNSKFYDVLLPVESLYAAMLQDSGFSSVEIKVSRKRTSKKELLEFVVSARKLT